MTTPSKLAPGDLVRRKGDPNAPAFRFVRHVGGYCRCQCDRYKGLAAPDDAGFVDVSDWDMAHRYERTSPNDSPATAIAGDRVGVHPASPSTTAP